MKEKLVQLEVKEKVEVLVQLENLGPLVQLGVKV